MSRDTSLRGRHLVRSAAMSALFAVAVHVVLAQIGGLETAARAILRTTWWLLPVAIGLEAMSLFAYGELVRLLLRGVGASARRGVVQRAVTVGNALGRSLPGGAPVASVMVARIIAGDKGPVGVVTTAVGASGVISSVVLMLILPVAALLALLSGHAPAMSFGTIALAAVAVMAVAALRGGMRKPETMVEVVVAPLRLIARGPIKRVIDPERVKRGLLQSVHRLNAVASDRQVLRGAILRAFLNWFFDLAVLALMAETIGGGASLLALPSAYVIGQLIAAVPLTPGGVGFVEAAMTGTLVGAGVPVGPATATVLGWRIVSHWLPIVVGLALLPFALQRRGSVSAGIAPPR